MDSKKEQSIKLKLETIKTDENETSEIKIRQLKSLINQMNLHLFENPDDKKKILTLQALGYEAILSVLDNDKEANIDEVQMQRDKTLSLIQVVNEEIQSLS